MLYTRMLWPFHVPVGTATAKLPFSKLRCPYFHNSPQISMTRLVSWLLRTSLLQGSP